MATQYKLSISDFGNCFCEVDERIRLSHLCKCNSDPFRWRMVICHDQ